ncbi:MAG: hypothetical protein GX555_17880 [Actinomycetales bacterium]|nr:hypothetical protein [Actinomycetales bacterium]
MLTSRRSLTALVAICGALVLNAFVLSPFWILAPAEKFTDTASVPAFPWSQGISWLLLTLLIPVIPALVRASRRAIPAWVIPVVQVALAMQAATHFVQGFVMAWLLPLAPEVLDLTTDGGALQIAMFAIWVFFLVTNVAFAVVLWRAGHSKVAAILMAVGAVVTPVFGPFGAGLLALGLTLIALGALRSRTEVASSQPEPVTV